ncbi:hypothetical protein TNCV_187371 [Trichonephila clavipes]|nr:hypothetical protein TNCV_187371 [Trichonephila clavipes]
MPEWMATTCPNTALYLADNIISRYWEARCQMVKKTSTGAITGRYTMTEINPDKRDKRSPVAEWLVHRASAPQVRGSNPELGKGYSAFHYKFQKMYLNLNVDE